MQRLNSSVLALLFGTFLFYGCSFSRPKEGQRAVGLSFELADSKGLNLAGENLIPLAIGIRIDGPNGFSYVRNTRAGDVIDLEVPVGELKIAASYMGLVGGPTDTLETFCKDMNKNSGPAPSPTPMNQQTPPPSPTAVTDNPALKLMGDTESGTDSKKKPDVIMGTASLVSNGDRAEELKLLFQVQRPKMVKIPIIVYASPGNPAKGARVEYLDAVTMQPIAPCPGQPAIGDNDRSNNGLVIGGFPITSGTMLFPFNVVFNGVPKAFKATLYSDNILNNMLTVTLSEPNPVAAVMDPNSDFDRDGVSNAEEVRLGTNPFQNIDTSQFKIWPPWKRNINGIEVWSTYIDFNMKNFYFNEVYYSIDGGARVKMDWQYGIRFDTEPTIGTHSVVIDALDGDGYKIQPFTKTFQYSGQPVYTNTGTCDPAKGPCTPSGTPAPCNPDSGTCGTNSGGSPAPVPYVMNSFPSENSVVDPTTSIRITFANMPDVDMTSVNSNTFQVRKFDNNTLVNCNFTSIKNPSVTLICQPSTALLPSSKYVVTINGIKNSSGGMQSSPFVRVFNTLIGGATTPLALIRGTPNDEEKDRPIVDGLNSIHAIFNKPIDMSTVSTLNFRVTNTRTNTELTCSSFTYEEHSDMNTGESTSYDVGCNLLPGSLSRATQYIVRIGSATSDIKDRYGLSLLQNLNQSIFAAKRAWTFWTAGSFTTGTPAAILAKYPPENITNASKSTNIAAYFDNPVVPLTGNTSTMGGAFFQLQEIGGPTIYLGNCFTTPRSINCGPGMTLLPGHGYQVTLNPVVDANGNIISPVSAPIKWHFAVTATEPNVAIALHSGSFSGNTFWKIFNAEGLFAMLNKSANIDWMSVNSSPMKIFRNGTQLCDAAGGMGRFNCGIDMLPPIARSESLNFVIDPARISTPDGSPGMTTVDGSITLTTPSTKPIFVLRAEPMMDNMVSRFNPLRFLLSEKLSSTILPNINTSIVLTRKSDNSPVKLSCSVHDENGPNSTIYSKVACQPVDNATIPAKIDLAAETRYVISMTGPLATSLDQPYNVEFDTFKTEPQSAVIGVDPMNTFGSGFSQFGVTLNNQLDLSYHSPIVSDCSFEVIETKTAVTPGTIVSNAMWRDSMSGGVDAPQTNGVTCSTNEPLPAGGNLYKLTVHLNNFKDRSGNTLDSYSWYFRAN